MTASITTAALAVAEAAEANRWNLEGIESATTSGKLFTFARGAFRAVVRVSDAGVILDATLWDREDNVHGSVTPRDKGKRETVVGWLEEAPAERKVAAEGVGTAYQRHTDKAARAERHRARVRAQIALRSRKG
jgi:hypothetical protein